MDNRISDFDEIREHISKFPETKYVCLLDQTKKKRVPFNRTSVPPLDQLARIEKMMEENVFPPGYYIVETRNAHNRERVENKYLVKCGNADPITIIEDEADSQVFHQPMSDHNLSVDDIIEIRVNNKELELEAQQLREQNALLEAENERLNEELEAATQEKQTLEDSSQPLKHVGEWFEQATPMLDRLLTQRDQRLALQAAQMEMQLQRLPQQQLANGQFVPPGQQPGFKNIPPGQPGQPQAPGAPAQQQAPQGYPTPPELAEEWNFEYLVNLFPTDPDQYDHWCTVMATEDPETYSEFEQYVTNLNREHEQR